ncbi:MAG: hypothetical protein Q8N18_17110 [Opitutaceae bacterium]|nr:hypothetical protein [Opitutaceae bacterium]
MILRALSVLLLLPFALLRAAETKAPPMAEVAGTFSGRWSADEGDAAGGLELTLRRDEKAMWAAEATLVFEGARAPTSIKSVKVEAGKVVIVFDWRIQDASGQSKISGELAGDTLSGVYESSNAEGVTRGKWTLKRAAGPSPKQS